MADSILDIEIDDSEMDRLVAQGEEDSVAGYLEVEGDHLQFDTKQLLKCLEALNVVVKDRQELVSKTVLMKYEEGEVSFNVNTGEFLVQVKVPVENKLRVLKEEYILPFRELYAVARSAGSRMVIAKKPTGTIFVRVYGGDVEFENYSLDRKIFLLGEYEKEKKSWGEKLRGADLVSFCNDARRAMALAIRPEDRRVRVNKDGMAFSNFVAALFYKKNTPLRNVSMRAMDLEFVAKVFDGVPEVYFREEDKKMVYTADRICAVVPKIDTEDLIPTEAIIQGIQTTHNFTLSGTGMQRILNLIKSMIGPTGVARLKTEEGRLFIRATTTTGKEVSFPVAVAPEGATVALNCSIAALVSALTLLRTETVLDLRADEMNRIMLVSGELNVYFGNLVG